MKRKFLIVLLGACLAIVSAFAFTACGETEKPDDGNGDNGNSTVVTPGGDTDNNGGTTDNGDTTDPEEPTTAVLKFNLLDDDTYEVIGYEGTPAKIVIPSEYNGKKVTSIGDQAFFYCNSLTSIAISYNVTRIGIGAFEWCGSLESATIPNSVIGIKNSAFLGCSSLTSITIPNSLTSIGDNAFYDCYRLVEVYNLSSISITKGSNDNGYIGYYALDIYTDANAPSKLTTENDFVIHSDGEVKTIIRYFGNKTEITIPSAVMYIGKYAFYNCGNLTSITIPESVNGIGEGAFWCCCRLVEVYNLSSLNITKGSYDNGNVGYYALDIYTDKNVLSKLTKENGFIIHNDGNIKILIGYFGDETEITLPSDITEIADNAFNLCYRLTNITIPDGVISIGREAFSGCSGLMRITIPNSVTNIRELALAYCSSLTSVILSNGLTEIGDEMFNGCSSLTSITIPNSVTSIGDRAFSNCSSLTSITVDENNSYYKSIDGNLYTKDGTMLIQYAIGKTDTSFIIPNSVTSIKGSAIDNYNSIFASKYENYYSFARVSPAFINMVEQSIICGIYTNIAELIQRDTIVGLHTLTKIALQNNENDIDIKEKSKNILAFLKENRKMLSELIRLRNKEICHFDKNVLTGSAVAQNAQCLNIKVLKRFLNRIEELVSQLRLACKKDGIHETMCPINSDDSNKMQDILDMFIEFKPEIIELKYQKKIKKLNNSPTE